MVCLGLCLAWSQNDVLTQHNDNMRSGQNPNEPYLTPVNVNVNNFGHLFTHTVDGAIAGQPLYASQILMNDGLVHNVVFVATMNNTVYAFDADNIQGSNAKPLWSVTIDDGGLPDPIADYGCTGTHYTEIGAMGTPVIDPGKTTLYVVAKTIEKSARYFRLHALNITNGSETNGGPVIITGSAQSNNGSGTFNPILQMQRPALLLDASGILYIAFGGNGCDEYAYNGWLFAYNSTSLQQEAAFLATPDGTRGSFWQGGSGPAQDENSYIYAVTANGTFDGPTGGNDYGDTVLKMGWNNGTFGAVDYFTPYNQATLSQQDLDLGSSGPLILPDQPGLYPHELVAGGKQGTIYLINRDNEGQYNATTDNVIQEIPSAVVSELTGIPSYWNSSVYIAGEGDYIKQFSLVNGLLSQQPVSQTTVSFTGAGPASTSITSNGTSNGILWAIRHTTPALFAFDPTNLAKEFYNTTQATQARDKMVPVARFATPTVSNGKVYIGGTSALEVYGLMPLLTVGTGNNQTGIEKTLLPTSLSVIAADAYTSSPISGVSITCKASVKGGVFTPSGTQTSGSNGTITFTYRLPPNPGTFTIGCTAAGFIGTSFNETSVIGPPVALKIISGNNQSAAPNTPLPQPIVIKVADYIGHGVQGVTINFTDNGAGGSFASASLVSNSAGTVSAQYTTGPNAGTTVITVSSGTLPHVSPHVTVQ